MRLKQPPDRSDVRAPRRNGRARCGHVSEKAIRFFRRISHRCVRIVVHRPVGDVLTFSFRVGQQGAGRVKVALTPNGVWLNEALRRGEAVGFWCTLSLADSSQAEFGELSSRNARFRLFVTKPRTEQ